MRAFLLAALAVALFACSPVWAQTADHVTAVRNAQKSAYAISDSTNECPVVGADMLGWPGSKVRKCIYEEGPGAHRLTGLVYLLEVAPEVIARWIETTCANQLAGVSACFATVLRCGRINSGMMFPISGNMMENMTPTVWKNYLFRNGMTVSFGGGENGSTSQLPVDRQEALARAEDSSIKSIPSGVTRYWRTLPRQFAARFPDAQAPTDLDSATARQKWLDIAKAEALAALDSPTNRLLEAWVASHPVTLRQGNCPEDGDH
jgi:hypothetical protein